MKTPVPHNLLYLTLAVMLYLPISAFAHETEWVVNVREVTTRDGLSSRFVNTIYQDTEDYLWFVTSEALNRYDGYRMEVFNIRKMDSEVSFPYQLFEDCNQNIWLASFSAGGPESPHSLRYDWRLDILNPFDKTLASAEDLLPFPIEELNWVGHIPGQLILLGTRDGQLFAYDGSYFKLFEDPEGDPVHHIVGLESGLIYFVAGDTLWMLNGEGEILGQMSVPDQFLSLDANPQGDLWGLFGEKNAAKKLLKLNPLTETYSEVALPEKLAERSTEALSWAVSPEGNIIAGHNGLLELLDSKGNLIVDISGELGEDLFLSKFTFDRSGALWGAHSRGLLKISWRPNPFRHFLHHDPVSIRGMDWVDDSTLLVANYTQILLLNVHSGKKEFVGDQSLSGLGLCRDTSGYWWLGAHAKYFIRFSPDFSSSKVYPISPPSLRMPRPNVEAMIPFVDTRGKIWLGLSQGLAFFDPETDQISIAQFSGPHAHLGDKKINHILEREGELWIATEQGLYLLDPEENKLSFFESFREFDIYHIHFDTKGHFWLATRGDGLIHWHPTTDEIWHYNTKNGFLSDVVYAILEDHNGTLWVSTNLGLVRYEHESDDFAFFRSGDWVTNEEFNYMAYAQNPQDGWIYFGGVGGITAFHPDSVEQFDLLDIPLRVTSFMAWVPESGEMQDHTSNLRKDGQIRLNPPVQSFQLSFALMGFQDPQYVQYAYWVEGLETDWVFLDEPTLRLTRLPPGRYVLHINGRSESGQWSSRALSIPLWVVRPFYLRPLFWVIAGLVLVLAAIVYYQIHLWQLRSRKKWLEQEVNLRTQDLQESQKVIQTQYQELDKINQTKDHLFLILAHELKNPVLSFRNVSQKINYLLQRNQTDRLMQLGSVLDKTASNAHNLLDNLLQWAKTQRGTFALHPRIINLHEAFCQVMEAYKPRVEEKEISLTTCLENKEISIWADPAAVQVLLRNLVDNAVKFTPKGGSICLCAEQKKDLTLLKVIDTGVGIKPEIKKNMFRPKSRPSTGTAGEKGTGLGLLLVRELMKLHGGKLRIESEPGKGSTFTLCFPSK